ncbi:hypothetical protein ACE0DR_25510 [Azotobacter sp. CWF10]
MMRPDTKVEKVYLYPKPVDFRKSIDGLAALVELDRSGGFCQSWQKSQFQRWAYVNGT